MAQPRDAQGHFLPRTPEPTPEPDIDEEGNVGEEPRPVSWGTETQGGTVFIETGRGQTAEVDIGAPFRETVEQLAEQAHYGGYFRVYLNGEEVVNPEESPATVQAGMRIVLTSYDKVG